MIATPIAVRTYAERLDHQRRAVAHRSSVRWPKAVLTFDTETTTDSTQRLLFGSYRYSRWSRTGLWCVEEGLFHADDLPTRGPEAFDVLQPFGKEREQERAGPASPVWRFRSRTEFVAEVLYKAAFKGRCLVVGFNLPFDLSRIAIDCGEARGRFRGGFSLVLWGYRDDTTGALRPDPYRPRLAIKHLDNKRSFIGWTGQREVDAVDRIPEGSLDGRPDRKYWFRGHFLDLRTLAFALTDQGYSLEAACQAFGVEHPKRATHAHGRITPEYIAYNLGDTLATEELLQALRAQYDRHPIELAPMKALSPASMAKAYLRAMGITP
jgi:hypothetical protein